MRNIKLLIFCTILIGSLQMQAQTLRYGISIGGGVASAVFDFSGYDNGGLDEPSLADPKIAFSINGRIQYQSAGKFGATMEPGFIQKGHIFHSFGNVHLNLNYLQVPLFLDYYPIDWLVCSVGPEFGYLLSATSVNDHIKSKYPYLEGRVFEIAGAAKVDFYITERASIGFKYSRAFTNFDELTFVDSSGTTAFVVSVYNEYLLLNLGYKF